MSTRTLFVVFGDQLDPFYREFLELDPERDVLWMAEVEGEVDDPPAHKRRIALFLSAMRHYRDGARNDGFTVHYHELGPERDEDAGADFGEVLAATVPDIAPERIVAIQPGDWRVLEMLQQAADAADLPLEIRPDPHFLHDLDDFRAWADGRKRFLMEDFYRMMRKETGILMEPGEDGGKPEPAGGEWNYDKENRESFGRDGPGDLPAPPRFEPDEITREVLDLVEARWPDHPGRLDDFAEAVTPDEAARALHAFIDERLPRFGTYQDALWEGESFLYHSRLSGYLNLKLLDPRDCMEAAEDAWHRDHAPLNAVEGFIRQILGWREYIRGIYWTFMPEYQDRNALELDDVDVPSFFWDGETDMACVADSMRTVLDHGYAHHIQRLMVLGLFAQLYGAHPYRFHQWHMALYMDAIDWVSLPNTLGMSQFGDGGLVGTKPYCASGQYISRQGNHCAGCRYDPKQATGDDACPFTTLYWDFLDRHRERFQGNRRMVFQVKNLERKSEDVVEEIRVQARELKERIAEGARV